MPRRLRPFQALGLASAVAGNALRELFGLVVSALIGVGEGDAKVAKNGIGLRRVLPAHLAELTSFLRASRFLLANLCL